MALRVEVSETGAEDLRRELVRMGDAIKRKVHRRALYFAGQPLAAAMRANIRRASGKTERNIRVRGMRMSGGHSVVGVIVGLTHRGKEGRLHIGRFLEFGTLRKNKRTGQVSHIPARPWARPAYDQTQARCAEVFEQKLWDLIERARDGGL